MKDLVEARKRFGVLLDKKVTAISVDANGMTIYFEEGYQLGPLSRFTGLTKVSIVRAEV